MNYVFHQGLHNGIKQSITFSWPVDTCFISECHRWRDWSLWLVLILQVKISSPWFWILSIEDVIFNIYPRLCHDIFTSSQMLSSSVLNCEWNVRLLAHFYYTSAFKGLNYRIISVADHQQLEGRIWIFTHQCTIVAEILWAERTKKKKKIRKNIPEIITHSPSLVQCYTKN